MELGAADPAVTVERIFACADESASTKLTLFFGVVNAASKACWVMLTSAISWLPLGGVVDAADGQRARLARGER